MCPFWPTPEVPAGLHRTHRSRHVAIARDVKIDKPVVLLLCEKWRFEMSLWLAITVGTIWLIVLVGVGASSIAYGREQMSTHD